MQLKDFKGMGHYHNDNNSKNELSNPLVLITICFCMKYMYKVLTKFLSTSLIKLFEQSNKLTMLGLEFTNTTRKTLKIEMSTIMLNIKKLKNKI